MAGTFPSPQAALAINVPNTGSVTVISSNPSRAGFYIFNPGAVVIWVCPTLSNNGLPLAAAVAGAGSIPIQPQQGIMFGAPGMPPFTQGMNAIAASGATNPLTLWEFYP
jgi:hypothetical protein